MSKPDYYETLGVNRDADDKTLKDAFRKMAMKYHPDRNPDNKEAEAKFKEVGEAYEALRDPQKRAAYDQFGHAAFQNGGAGGSMNDIYEEFENAFMEMMSGGTRSHGVEYEIKISLKEAFEGKTVKIDLPMPIICQTCSGSGAEPGTSPVICQTCGGGGKIRISRGLLSVQKICPNCQGRGEIIVDVCSTCRGARVINQIETFPIDLPPGIDNGIRIRVPHESEIRNWGKLSKNFYIFISIEPHPIFRRDGADIYCEVPISFITATLGGEFEVMAIDGTTQKVKVPEGTQTGRRFRLRGKGMPIFRRRGRGDMYVQVVVEIPQKLSKKQKEMLKKFEEQTSEDNNPQSTNFLNKIKNLFE